MLNSYIAVKALAKFIAWQLTCTNFNSSKWVKLGGYLSECDSQLYRQICKKVDEQAAKAPQRERCEHYILYWANHHAPSESDKVTCQYIPLGQEFNLMYKLYSFMVII